MVCLAVKVDVIDIPGTKIGLEGGKYGRHLHLHQGSLGPVNVQIEIGGIGRVHLFFYGNIE
jgi:hypothetical protein